MPGKFKIVVSDLHLSAGFVKEGNPLEDFGSDQEFVALLDEVIDESEREGAEVELIFNGDLFEMLQVPHVADFEPATEYPSKQYHSSSEEDSVLKMAIIVKGHRLVFEGLGRFLRVGPPRRHIAFIKGNHDLNLHWSGVQAAIRDALGAHSGRHSLVSFEERRISREGIYVEHGNQYAEGVDRVEDMEEPHDHDDPQQLAIPLGSWFVMDVFNKVEREKYWIDGVKPITALVWYALEFDFGFALRAISRLAGSLPGILWEGLRAPEEPPVELMDRQLEEPGQVEALAGRYETDEAFRTQFNVELAELMGAPVEPAMGDVRGAFASGDPVEMGDRVRSRVRSSLYEMAVARAAEEGVKLVTFGHTHDAGVEKLPGGGAYINSGTWTWRADFGSSGKQTWKDLFTHPELFTDDRLLTYVRIDYDEEGQPSGRLLSYEPGAGGSSRSMVDGPPSIWHRIENWIRRLAEFFGIDM
jgi:UDP-2,3-diacylglucosamine pyrophosphatase LpxH